MDVLIMTALWAVPAGGFFSAGFLFGRAYQMREETKRIRKRLADLRNSGRGAYDLIDYRSGE